MISAQTRGKWASERKSGSSESIGWSIIENLRQRPDVEVVFVLGRNLDKLAARGVPETVITDSADEALSRDVDLVIEAAVPELVAELAPRFLEKALTPLLPILLMSVRNGRTSRSLPSTLPEPSTRRSPQNGRVAISGSGVQAIAERLSCSCRGTYPLQGIQCGAASFGGNRLRS